MRERECQCKECGKAFKAIRRQATFCGDPCRAAFNRRRRDRGAELYDFAMCGHNDKIEMLIKAYRCSDRSLRDGRPSWQDTTLAMINMPAVFGIEGDRR
jgi:hypothetical protein